MPATSVKIKDDEILALKGEFKAAAREIEREYKELQKKILDDLKNGKTIDPAIAQRGSDLLTRQKSYLAKEKEAKEIADIAQKSTVKTVANLFNTHNPHGAVRSIFRGRPSAGVLESAGEGIADFGANNGMPGLAGFGKNLALRAPMLAATGLIAGLVTQAVFSQMQEAADANLKAAQIDKKLAEERANTAYQLRYSSGATAYLTQRQQAAMQAAQASTLQNNTGGSALVNVGLSGVPGVGPLLGLLQHYDEAKFGELSGAKRRALSEDMQILNRPGSRAHAMSREQLEEMAKRNEDSGEVNRHFTWKEQGTFGWLKSQTIGRLNGERQREREDAAMELTTKQVKGLAAKADEEQRVWDEDPVNKVMMREMAHHDRQVEEWDIKKFNDWNHV